MSNKETDEQYKNVRFNINTNYRVASCAEGRQWIVQRRLNEFRWENQAFFSRKENLGPYLKEKFEPLDFSKQVDELPI